MIALSDIDPAFHARVANELASDADGIESVDLATLVERASSGGASPDVVLLGPSAGSQEALRVAQALQRTAPEIGVIIVTDSLTSDLLQAALRSGVRDVLPSSFTPEQLHEAIGRASAASSAMRGRGAMPPPEPDPSEACKVITVFSAKGGVGKSFVASNLSVLMAEKHARVALVDLDLQFGDLAIMMQLFPAHTIADASTNLERLDADALTGYLTPHRSGISLLAAPLEPGLAETIQPQATQRILRLARRAYSCVVIDTPPLFTEHVLAALDESDEVVFLTSLDVPSIKNTKLALQTLDMLGVGRERIRLLLNRADSQVGLRVQEVERMLGARVAVQIPSSREVPLSINQGVPIAFGEPRSTVTTPLRELAASIARGAPAATAQRRNGRFGIRRRAS